MATIPPTPAPAVEESSRVVAETTGVTGGGDNLARSIELFNVDYDATNGNLASIAINDESNKRKTRAPRGPASSPTRSPIKKKRPPASSPMRALVAAASIVNTVANRVVGPPELIRNGPSPTSVALDNDDTDDAVKPPAPLEQPKEPKRGNTAMIGLVPKSDFFRFARRIHFMN